MSCLECFGRRGQSYALAWDLLVILVDALYKVPRSYPFVFFVLFFEGGSFFFMQKKETVSS